MTEINKIAEITKSALPDSLKLELIGLLATRQPSWVLPWVGPIYPTYPLQPSSPLYPVGPTWIGTGTGDAIPFPWSTTTWLTLS